VSSVVAHVGVWCCYIYCSVPCFGTFAPIVLFIVVASVEVVVIAVFAIFVTAIWLDLILLLE
jgi:hypothetical protein